MKIDKGGKMSNKSAISASDEIWSILREVSASQKQAKEEMQEIRTGQKETSRQIKIFSAETNQQIKENIQGLKEARKLFETQWGKLVESLIDGKLVELLRARGIEVRQTSQRVEVFYEKREGGIQRREFDILAVNGKEVVVVEVKTTLTPDKARYFLESLKDFKRYFPDYKSKTVYGAVAYLRSESEAYLFSQRQGLFVIRATGDSASIINTKDFKPKVFP